MLCVYVYLQMYFVHLIYKPESFLSLDSEKLTKANSLYFIIFAANDLKPNKRRWWLAKQATKHIQVDTSLPIFF